VADPMAPIAVKPCSPPTLFKASYERSSERPPSIVERFCPTAEDDPRPFSSELARLFR